MKKATHTISISMTVELAKAIVVELRDTTKATYKYLSSGEGTFGGRFSWGKTNDKEHKACLRKMATNDTAETPFA